MLINYSKISSLVLAGVLATSCASHQIASPVAETITFDSNNKEAKSEVEKILKVKFYGDGIKDTKKFAIGAFQVRFRSDLSAKLTLKDRNCSGSFIDYFGLGENNEAVFQKVTEDLYKDFVTGLKQRGLQIVSFDELKKQPDFQIAQKEALHSGKFVELTAGEISNPFYEDEIYGRIPIGDVLGLKNKGSYFLYAPKEVPNFEYKIIGGASDDYDVVVLPGNVPEHRIAAASHLGAGIITAGFEVEMMKFNYDACVIKTEITIANKPMLRTRMTSFNALPIGAKTGFSLFGNSLNNGIVVSPKNRGGKHGTGFISSMMNSKVFGTQWSEVDDGSVYLDKTDVKIIPDKFTTAFKKSTAVHLDMIMNVLDHQADYK